MHLDDAVVQVAADPISLIHDRQPLDLLVEARVLDRDARVQGKRLDQRLIVRAELGASCLLVRYRPPTTSPLTVTGTPRNECMGGWLGGKP